MRLMKLRACGKEKSMLRKRIGTNPSRSVYWQQMPSSIPHNLELTFFDVAFISVILNFTIDFLEIILIIIQVFFDIIILLRLLVKRRVLLDILVIASVFDILPFIPIDVIFLGVFLVLGRWWRGRRRRVIGFLVDHRGRRWGLRSYRRVCRRRRGILDWCSILIDIRPGVGVDKNLPFG